MYRSCLALSVSAHAVLLTLLYYFGSLQPERRAQAAEVAESLRATHEAGTVKRLEDLHTIKRLMEKSAARVDEEPRTDPGDSPPQTPEEMLERARELSRDIDALDEEIRAEELAALLGEDALPQIPAPMPAPSAALESPAAAPKAAPIEEAGAVDDDAGRHEPLMQAAVTPESAAREVAALEARARETLAKRQLRLEARANGVQVQMHSAKGEGSADGIAPSPGSGDGADAALSAEIAQFIGAGEGTGIDPRTPATTYSNAGFFGRGYGEIPPVDATDLVLGRGRMFGAGGEYASRVYLNSWYIIGPFPGRHGAGLFDNPSHPPEQAVLLDAVYYGKDNRLLRWRYVTAQSYPLVPPDSVEDSVYYGYTEVFVDEACDLIAWIGVDDDVQIYMNDRLVWRGGNIDKQWYFDEVFRSGTTYLRDYNRTEDRRLLHFNKGRNRIFFKLSNGPNYPFLSLVLTSG